MADGLAFASDDRAEAFFRRYDSRKLNLGCGTDLRDGYVNVDMHDFGRSNTLASDVIDLPALPSSNFTEIVAQDVIEHIRWRDTPRALLEWNRLLAVGGTLYIRTTWLNGLTRLFERPESQPIPRQIMLLTNLFSRQLIDGDFHFTALTEPLLRFYMWSSGFEIRRVHIKDRWIFEVWAEKVADLYPASLVLPGSSDADFVDAAYRTILKREPDGGGRDAMIESLRGEGATRTLALRTLILSEENQARLMRECPAFETEFDPDKLDQP